MEADGIPKRFIWVKIDVALGRSSKGLVNLIGGVSTLAIRASNQT
jgi:hypothetical protein